MADKLEKMRERLRLGNLDEGNKKNMFQKFQDAGGKVVDLNKEMKAQEAKEAKNQKAAAKSSGGYAGRDSGGDGYVQPRNLRRERQRSSIDRKEEANQNAPLEQSPLAKAIERFATKMGCFFSGVLSFSGKKFRSGFSDLILNKYQNTLLESRMVLASLLHQSNVVVEEVKKKLTYDQARPLMYELIVRYDNLYNEGMFARISYIKDNPKQVEEQKENIKELFKSLYMLKSYVEYLRSSLERAILLEKDLRRIDPEVSYSNFRKLNNGVNLVFQKVYPKLFMLIDYYYKHDTKDTVISFKDYINIRDEDVVGYFTNTWREAKEFETTKENVRKGLKGETSSEDGESDKGDDSSKNAKSKEGGDDSFVRGIAFLNENLMFAKVLAEFKGKKDLRSLFSLNDKVFLSYCIVDFFDKEYSFLFNSNKVRFNVILLNGGRVDVKKELADQYYHVNSVYERVNEYLKVIRDIRKTESDTYISRDEKSTLLNQSSVQRSQISRAIRKDARALFENFEKTLLYIMNDCHSDKTIVQGLDDIVEFDSKYDGIRITNGKTVLTAIQEAYDLASTIHYLMSDGDLGGFSVVIEKPQYLKLVSE